VGRRWAHLVRVRVRVRDTGRGRGQIRVRARVKGGVRVQVRWAHSWYEVLQPSRHGNGALLGQRPPKCRPMHAS